MAKGDEQITGNEDVLDSRDINERIDYLEDFLQQAYDEYIGSNNVNNNTEPPFEFDEWKNDIFKIQGKYQSEIEELNALIELKFDIQSSEWQYGLALINENYWVDYVEELCKDIGDIPRNIPWYIEIDWKKTAEHIRQDYGETNFMGTNYYYRY